MMLAPLNFLLEDFLAWKCRQFVPYPYCKRTDCPDCKSRSSSSHAAIDIMTGTSDMSSSCPIQYVEWVKSFTLFYQHMDVLDVEVQDSEVHSLDVDLRQEFPEEGMSCQVPECGDGHYPLLATYRKHWRRSHVREILLFHCDSCSHREIEKRNMIHHNKKKHKRKSTFTQKTSINKAFVDPKGVLPPKKSYSKLLENMFTEDVIPVPRDSDSVLKFHEDGSSSFHVKY